MPKSYSFFRLHGSDESHIFKGVISGTECTVSVECICQKITPSQGNWVIGAVCLNDYEAGDKAVEFGKAVCGDCVSGLYSTY